MKHDALTSQDTIAATLLFGFNYNFALGRHLIQE